MLNFFQIKYLDVDTHGAFDSGSVYFISECQGLEITKKAENRKLFSETSSQSISFARGSHLQYIKRTQQDDRWIKNNKNYLKSILKKKKMVSSVFYRKKALPRHL